MEASSIGFFTSNHINTYPLYLSFLIKQSQHAAVQIPYHHTVIISIKTIQIIDLVRLHLLCDLLHFITALLFIMPIIVTVRGLQPTKLRVTCYQ